MLFYGKGFNIFISGNVISQNMEFIRLAISQPFFKDRDYWFGPQDSLNIRAEYFTMFEVIKCMSGHVTGHKLFI